MKRIERAERRKYHRYKVKKGAFAILWPNFQKIGEVIDISRSGVTFYCSADKESQNESNEMDIFWHDHSFYLDGIPCKVIYETKIADESSSTPETMRRIGVQFGDVNPDQSSQLSYFIQNYTIGET